MASDIGPKPAEQVLKEWTLDCIRFRGRGTNRRWTRHGFTMLARAIREGNDNIPLQAAMKNSNDTYSVMIHDAFHMDDIEGLTTWFRELRRTAQVTPQWLASWTSMESLFFAIRDDYRATLPEDVRKALYLEDKKGDKRTVPNRSRPRPSDAGPGKGALSLFRR